MQVREMGVRENSQKYIQNYIDLCEKWRENTIFKARHYTHTHTHTHTYIHKHTSIHTFINANPHTCLLKCPGKGPQAKKKTHWLVNWQTRWYHKNSSP